MHSLDPNQYLLAEQIAQAVAMLVLSIALQWSLNLPWTGRTTNYILLNRAWLGTFCFMLWITFTEESSYSLPNFEMLLIHCVKTPVGLVCFETATPLPPGQCVTMGVFCCGLQGEGVLWLAAGVHQPLAGEGDRQGGTQCQGDGRLAGGQWQDGRRGVLQRDHPVGDPDRWQRNWDRLVCSL